jgi:hypothetical protein
MSYALFVYDTPGSLDTLTPEEKQAVHDEYAELVGAGIPSSSFIRRFRTRG